MIRIGATKAISTIACPFCAGFHWLITIWAVDVRGSVTAPNNGTGMLYLYWTVTCTTLPGELSGLHGLTFGRHQTGVTVSWLLLLSS